MKLLMTLFKDREKNKIVWKITSKADFNSKGDTIQRWWRKPLEKRKIQSSYISFVLVLVPLGTTGTNDGF